MNAAYMVGSKGLVDVERSHPVAAPSEDPVGEALPGADDEDGLRAQAADVAMLVVGIYEGREGEFLRPDGLGPPA